MCSTGGGCSSRCCAVDGGTITAVLQREHDFNHRRGRQSRVGRRHAPGGWNPRARLQLPPRSSESGWQAARARRMEPASTTSTTAAVVRVVLAARARRMERRARPREHDFNHHRGRQSRVGRRHALGGWSDEHQAQMPLRSRGPDSTSSANTSSTTQLGASVGLGTPEREVPTGLWLSVSRGTCDQRLNLALIRSLRPLTSQPARLRLPANGSVPARGGARPPTRRAGH